MRNLSLPLSNFGHRFLFTTIGFVWTNNVYAYTPTEALFGASLSAILSIILLFISFRVSKRSAHFIRILAGILSLPLILLLLFTGLFFSIC